ncbi:MAG: cation:proton antiporter [Gammaproteobacteria bacterium]|nr:MAG: cation:proton antiporter [Gammaproteobacteria bacterium]
MQEQLPALLIIIPLMAAPLCVIVRHALVCWWIALVASASSLFCAFRLLGVVSADGPLHYALGGWAAPTGIEYYVDSLNAVVLLLVTGIALVALLYARESIAGSIQEGRRYLFYTVWLLCMTGLAGMLVTGDAFNVFVFLEISSLATYTLISFGEDRRALTASFRYLVLGSVGASFILIGIGFLYAATGTLNMQDLAARIPESESQRAILVAFCFLTIGVMIKSAIFPLHAWQPNAYHFGPVSSTAFIAGTASKVSLYVLLRFFFGIFGEEFAMREHFLTAALLPAAVAGFIIMSLVAIYQNDLRRMLAFSSVAQIGYIVAGISLATEAGLTAGIAHMINHGMIKAALFLAVGCILFRVGHCHTPSLDELFRRMPLTCTAFTIAGLALIGVPLTAGFVSKAALIGAAIEHGWWLIAVLILVSSLLSIIYVGRVIEIMIFRRSRSLAPSAAGYDEAPLAMLIPLYVLVALIVLLGIRGDLVLDLANAGAIDLLGGFR